MRESELLGAVDAAELVAPILDRLRLHLAGAVRERVEALGSFGLSPQAMGTVAMLRNTVPDRAVAREAVAAVFRYSPPEGVQAALDEAVASGVLREPEAGLVALTGRGVEAVEACYAIGSEILAERWAGHEERVEGLLELTEIAVEAAAATGGEAFSVVHPVHEPPGGSDAMRLAERLTPLRFHRFDAHIAAWEAAGLTVEEIVALGPGSQRDAIEADTNRRAAAPYEALLPWERLELIACLGALPG
jgi:hypothetical protein